MARKRKPVTHLEAMKRRVTASDQVWVHVPIKDGDTLARLGKGAAYELLNGNASADESEVLFTIVEHKVEGEDHIILKALS